MTPRLLLTVALLTLTNGFNYIDRMLVAALGPDIKRDLGLSDTEFGLLSGPAFALSYAAASIFFGFLADRSSRRTMISAAFAFWSSMTIISGFTVNSLQLSLARAGYGLGASGFGPAAFSYWSDSNIPQNRRSLVFGIFHAGSMTGILMTFVVGGALSAAHGWRMSLILMGGIGLVLALALPFLIPEPPRGEASSGAPVKPNFKDTFSQLGDNRTYLFIMVGISVGNFAGIGVISWLPLFFQRSHDMSHSELSFIFGPALSIGMIIGMLSGGWVGDQLSTRFGKIGPLYLCMGATIIVALLYWVILLVPFVSVAIALIVVAAGLSIIYIPAYSVVLRSILEPHVRATGLAVLVFMSNVLGLGILPVVVGAMSDSLTAHVGPDGLRYALMVVLSGNFIAAWAFSQARKSITA